MIKSIKLLIWVYLILLVLEGALRKWILPSLSSPLLIVRDPVVAMIYALALAKGVFPHSRFVICTAILAAASVLVSFLGGCDQPVVILYGLRINYLHIPLIFVMAEVLTRKDVERLGIMLLLLAIPNTLLMIQQFRASPDDWLNKGVGDGEGGQLFGAEGRIRPPGFFSFISGPQNYYPLCAAFFLYMVSRRKGLILTVILAAGVAIAVALPVSISRTCMVATMIVGVVYLITMPFATGISLKFIKPAIVLLIIGLIISQLSIFSEGSSAFTTRWTTAAGADTNGWMDLIGRIGGIIDLTIESITNAPLFGSGIGMGSNFGSQFTTGSMQFMLAEDEWAKVLLELGLPVGLGFIVLRVALGLYIGSKSISVLVHNKDPLPILIFSSCAVILVYGQWGPPVILGFAVLGSGLTLAAIKHSETLEGMEMITESSLQEDVQVPQEFPSIDQKAESRRLPSSKRSEHDRR